MADAQQHDHDSALLAEQSTYYRQRAGEYEDWWYRRAGYDNGAQSNERWFAQTLQLERALAQFAPTGSVLELACGTGLWTRHLARAADRVTALDGSAEMIALNREQVNAPNVYYTQADLFKWQPSETYDVCFFGFWLSHVPAQRFAGFWRMVGAALRPGGRVFFIDSARSDRRRGDRSEDETMTRELSDGRRFQIVKRFYEPAWLTDELRKLGFAATVQATSEYFIYGSATLTE
jgi:demethylmenaquinone methyltransferase/2-methoxy-6-polyprenyl-1,4-benzoquinol methylase